MLLVEKLKLARVNYLEYKIIAQYEHRFNFLITDILATIAKKKGSQSFTTYVVNIFIASFSYAFEEKQCNT